MVVCCIQKEHACMSKYSKWHCTQVSFHSRTGLKWDAGIHRNKIFQNFNFEMKKNCFLSRKWKAVTFLSTFYYTLLGLDKWCQSKLFLPLKFYFWNALLDVTKDKVPTPLKLHSKMTKIQQKTTWEMGSKVYL